MAIKAFNYWLNLALNNIELTNELTFLDERLGVDSQDPNALMDASYILYLLGDRVKSNSYRAKAFNISDTFKYSAQNLEATDLKWLNVFYDKNNLEYLGGRHTSLYFMSTGNLLNNAQIEHLARQRDIIFVYVNQNSVIGQLPNIPKINCIAANSENESLLLMLSKNLAEHSILNHPKDVLKICPSYKSDLIKSLPNVYIEDDFEKIPYTFRVIMIDGIPYPCIDYLSNKSVDLLDPKNHQIFENAVLIGNKKFFDLIYQKTNLDYVVIDFYIDDAGYIGLVEINTNPLIYSPQQDKLYQTIVNKFNDMMFKYSFKH